MSAWYEQARRQHTPFDAVRYVGLMHEEDRRKKQRNHDEVQDILSGIASLVAA